VIFGIKKPGKGIPAKCTKANLSTRAFLDEPTGVKSPRISDGSFMAELLENKED